MNPNLAPLNPKLTLRPLRSLPRRVGHSVPDRKVKLKNDRGRTRGASELIIIVEFRVLCP